jgi:hypothetical protein
MKLNEFSLIEEIGGKNKKLFDENEDITDSYVKKQLYDIRKAKKHEKVEITIGGGKPKSVRTAQFGDYVLRLDDNIEKVDIITSYDLRKYEQIQPNAEPDAEGYIVYREKGEYDAFQYTGENVYIFTDWNTKQMLKSGDYLVKEANNPKSSGFVVPAADFDENFEKIK